MKSLIRFLALAVLVAGFTLSNLPQSFAVDPPNDPLQSRVDQLQREVAKVDAYGRELRAKLDAARAKKLTARVSMLKILVTANDARLVKVKGQLEEAQATVRNTHTTTVITESPRPVFTPPTTTTVVTTRQPSSQYEIGLGVGYMGNGIGIIGELNMPNVFTSMVMDDTQKRMGINPPVQLGIGIGGGFVQGSTPTSTIARYAPLMVNGILSYAPEKDYTIYFKGGVNLPIGGSGTGLIGPQLAVGAAWSPSGELGRDKIFVEAGYAIFRRTTVGSAKQVTGMVGYRVGF